MAAPCGGGRMPEPMLIEQIAAALGAIGHDPSCGTGTAGLVMDGDWEIGRICACTREARIAQAVAAAIEAAVERAARGFEDNLNQGFAPIIARADYWDAAVGALRSQGERTP